MTSLKTYPTMTAKGIEFELEKALAKKGYTTSKPLKFNDTQGMVEKLEMVNELMKTNKILTFGLVVKTLHFRKDLDFYGIAGGKFLLLEVGQHPDHVPHYSFETIDELVQKLEELLK